MRSFTTRFTLLYVAIAASLLLALTIATTAAAINTYVRILNETVAPAAARSSARMSEALARGASFEDAAANVVRQFDHPLMRIAIYDAYHRRVARSGGRGNEQGDAPSAFAALATLEGLRSSEAPIPGGSLEVAPDASHFGRTLAGYWLRTVPFGLVAIGVAFLLGRAITRQALAPVTSVTAALRSFADGNFVPNARVTADYDEFAALADAYYDAIVQAQRGFEAREKAQLQMQQFIADAGHALRTPLTVVMGYLDALRDGIVLDPRRVTRAYESMLGECRRMRMLVDKLTYLARLDETKWLRAAPTTIDVAALTRDLIEGMLPVAPLLQLAVDTGGGEASVVADEKELREAIANVVDNAVKYAPDLPIEVAVGRYDGRVLVDVVDHGPGMSAEDLTHAFDRFYRGSARQDIEGSGLGLAISKRAIERMDGTIALASEFGAGTRVTLSLPRVPAASAAAAQKPS